MTTSSRWQRRPEGSNWGDFGPDDQLGRLNLLTPEKVRQGVAEVREGLTFSACRSTIPAAISSTRAAIRRCSGRRCATVGRT
jgi:hypothetical protein